MRPFWVRCVVAEELAPMTCPLVFHRVRHKAAPLRLPQPCSSSMQSLNSPREKTLSWRILHPVAFHCFPRTAGRAKQTGCGANFFSLHSGAAECLGHSCTVVNGTIGMWDSFPCNTMTATHPGRTLSQRLFERYFDADYFLTPRL